MRTMADRPELKKKGDAAFKGKRYTEAIEHYTTLVEVVIGAPLPR